MDIESRQFLTLTLDEEIFAIEISRVREVLDYAPVTVVPKMPAYFHGVINLRGAVLTVIDLKLKFGMSQNERTCNTCIIIVEVLFDDETMLIGLLADSVRKVFDINTTDIEPPPKMGTRLSTKYIRGMVQQDDEFVVILNLDMILSAQEVSADSLSGRLNATSSDTGSDGLVAGSPERA